eukprot:10519647-Alexandrium_andersonii.AAC.1
MLSRGSLELSGTSRSSLEPSGALQGSVAERSGNHKLAVALAIASLRSQRRTRTCGGGSSVALQASRKKTARVITQELDSLNVN